MLSYRKTQEGENHRKEPVKVGAVNWSKSSETKMSQGNLLQYSAEALGSQKKQ